MCQLHPRTIILAEHRCQLDRFRRHALRAAPCLAGYELHTPDSLARLVAEEIPGRGQLLTGTAQREILRQAIEQAVPAEGRVAWQLPGVVRQVRAIFADAVLAGLTELPAALAGGRLAAAYTAYRGLKNGQFDDADVLLGLVQILRDSAPSLPFPLADAATVRLVGFADPVGWKRDLLEELHNRLGTDRMLSDEGGEPGAVVPDELRQVFRGQPAPAGWGDQPPASIEFLQCASREVELRTLARRVRAIVGGASRAGHHAAPGDPRDPDDVLVVVPPGGGYRERLAELLEDCGIPHDVVRRRPLADTPLGEFLLSLARINPASITWQELIGLLNSPFVVLRNLRPEGSTLTVRTVVRNITSLKLRRGGWQNWAGAIGAAAARLRAEAQACADEDPVVSERLNNRAAGLENIQEDFAAMVGRLREILGDGGPRTIQDWVEWLLGAMARDRLGTATVIGMATAADAAPEANGSEAIKKLLAELRVGADPATGEIGREEFLGRLESELRLVQAAEAVSATAAVNIRAPEEVEHGTWPWVFVVGLNETALPCTARASGLVTDDLRRALGLERVPDENARHEGELLRAIGRAGQSLVMSYAVLGADGKQVSPAVIFQRLDDALATWQPVAGGVPQRVSRFFPVNGQPTNWVHVVSPRHLLPDATSAVTPDEAEVHNRLSAMAGNDPDLPDIEQWARLDAWVENDTGRDTPLTRFGAANVRPVLSPSSLDQFGQCPYRYYGKYVLGLEAPRDVDLVPDAMEIGTALHRALERLVREIIEDPNRGPTFFLCVDEAEHVAHTDQSRERLRTCLEEQFAALGQNGMALDATATARLRDRWSQVLTSALLPKLIRINPEIRLNQEWETAVAEVRSKMEGKQPGDRGSAEALLREYQTARADLAALPRPAEYPKGYKGKFEDLEKILGRCREQLPPLVPLHCEWVFGGQEGLAIEIANGQQVRLRGKIDRIDGPWPAQGDQRPGAVMDYKSGREVPSPARLQREVLDGIHFQLGIYALALLAQQQDPNLPERLRGLAPRRSVLIKLRDGSPSPVEMTGDVLEQVRTWLGRAVDHINAGRLAPLPKKGCPIVHGGYNRCDYEDLCRARTIPTGWFEHGYPDLRPAEQGAGGNEP